MSEKAVCAVCGRALVWHPSRVGYSDGPGWAHVQPDENLGHVGKPLPQRVS